jgi:hypothetical protein
VPNALIDGIVVIHMEKKLLSIAGKLKSLRVQRAIKLCEQIKFGEKPQYYEASLKVDGHNRP